MKKKLYGSVLLIGGGLSFSQASGLLQVRLESSLPAQFSKGSDTVEVSSNPRVRRGLANNNALAREPVPVLIYYMLMIQ